MTSLPGPSDMSPKYRRLLRSQGIILITVRVDISNGINGMEA